jgi:hypothetical protein
MSEHCWHGLIAVVEEKSRFQWREGNVFFSVLIFLGVELILHNVKQLK